MNTPRSATATVALRLHAAAEAVRLHTLVLPLGLHAGAAEADTPIAAEIIPPAGPDGCIEGADGRRQYVRDMAALAAAIATQAVQPRIDRDHASERTSPTFSGSTAASGWVRNPRLNGRGGIDAEMRAHVVTGETAALDGEPFDAMQRSVSFMPSMTARICTSELKVLTIDRHLWQVWNLAKRPIRKLIGFRFDEPARWKPVLYEQCEAAYPMVDAGVTKADVAAFRRHQPFDLGCRVSTATAISAA